MPDYRSTLAVVCALAACMRPGGAAAPQVPKQEAVPGAPAAGVDLGALDRDVKPGDDFDAYANGAWRRSATIPEDRASTGAFMDVFQRAERRNAELIQSLAATQPAPGSDARRIADYYAAFMDEANIEKLGFAPLQPQLQKIAALQSKQELARALGAELRADVDPINATQLETEHLFGLFVAQGLEDPAHNTAYLLQGGLGMPNRDYYLSSDTEMIAARDRYRAYVSALLALAGIAEAPAKAESILALETKIARAHASIVESEDVHNANNPWPLPAFSQHAPGLEWAAFFEAAGLARQAQVIAWQPGAIRGLAALLNSEPLPVWKDWFTFHALNHSAHILPKAAADLHFEFHGRALKGTPRQLDRWKRAIDSTNADLGDAVGALYVERFFPPTSRALVEAMVENIIAAFRDRVDNLEWMSPATKQKAKAKAATLRVAVGGPRSYRDYAKLEIRPDDPVGNQLRAELFEYEHQRAKLDKPVDRDEWWMTPQTVNAVNLPLQNALNFPAAILDAPFFDPAADAAANYGAIGSVIGHEVSHSFDNLGAEFDAEGRLANWWTPEDLQHFKAAGQRLVAQYDAYEPLPGLHINGQQTLGENIADVSGLTIAHAAYVKSLGGQPAPMLEGLSGEQRFFLAYAQVWRQKTREAALRQQIVADGHAPGAFRAQTVRNLDAWYRAFPSEPGDKLHLAPENRVHIW